MREKAALKGRLFVLSHPRIDDLQPRGNRGVAGKATLASGRAATMRISPGFIRVST
jgi:hypothetical protein